MRRNLRPLFFVLAILVLLAGCQTTTTLYEKSSFTSRPSSSNYTNSDEFVRDSIVYLYPRKCVFYQTSDGFRDSKNQKPDKFSFFSIIENGEKKDEWYTASLSVTNAFYGTLGFSFNKDTGEYSCGWPKNRRTGRVVKFFPGRHLDLASLPSAKLKKGMGRYTDRYICNLSIDHSEQPLKWDTVNASVKKYLDEAKRRGLTLGACSKYEAKNAKIQKAKAPPTVDKGHQLSGKEIKSTYSGTTIKALAADNYPFLRSDVTVEYGVIKPGSKGRMAGQTVSGRIDLGKWWIKNDKICRRWNSWLKGTSNCFTIKLDGEYLKWIKDDGNLHGMHRVPSLPSAKQRVYGSSFGEACKKALQCCSGGNTNQWSTGFYGEVEAVKKFGFSVNDCRLVVK